MAKEQHLTYFKVENFKRFDSFEMEDIGQFNLIVGDNNVGKTSVLEALLFDEDKNLFSISLKKVLFEYRQFQNLKKSYLYYFKNLNSLVNEIKFCYQNPLTDIFDIKISRVENPEKWVYSTKIAKFPSFTPPTNEDFPSNNDVFSISIPYIPFNKTYDNDLTDFYSQNIQISKKAKEDLITALQVMIPEIENLEPSTTTTNNSTLVIYQKDVDAVMPLAIFGEGTLKLFRILTEIVVNKGKRLMIDEIDTGIHHKRFKDFWRTILKAARANDVQLFVTTHNEECLRYFKEVLEESEMIDYQADARCYSLIELPDKSVKAYKYEFEQFEYAIEQGIDIRGEI